MAKIYYLNFRDDNMDSIQRKIKQSKEDLVNLYIEELREKRDNARFIQNLLLLYDLQGFPIRIGELARNMNFNIIFQKFEDKNLSGYIALNSSILSKLDGDYSKFIAINQGDSTEHQRFAIAHELAHYFLHYNYKEKEEFIDAYYNDDKMLNQIEYDANQFAADLLMPKVDFTKEYMSFKALGLSKKEIEKNWKKNFLFLILLS